MRDRSARFTVLSDIGYCRTATLFTLENGAFCERHLQQPDRPVPLACAHYRNI